MEDLPPDVSATASGLGTEALISKLLQVARARTGMELAWVSRFADGAQILEITDGASGEVTVGGGTSLAMEGSYCVRVIDGRLPNIIADARGNPATSGLEVTEELNIGSYIGVPLTAASGAVNGMLCAIRPTANPDLGEDAHRFMQLLAAVVGDLLEDERSGHERVQHIRDRVGKVLAGGQLRSFLQPVVDLRTGAVVGVEALARFPGEPRRPDVWFAEAELVGLGAPLQLAAVRAAVDCRNDLPDGLWLSVNVSPATLMHPELSESVLASSPHRIVLELTEHSRIDRYDEVRRLLQPLRSAGVRLAVDDVGAGFASLSHVLELTPDVLKIDLSVTRGIDTDPARQQLVLGILAAARQLDAATIAEGVETTAELTCLRDLEIGYAQGYALARPAPPPLQTASLADRLPPATETRGHDPAGAAGDRFRDALSNAPIGVALVGLDGTFLHANARLEELLGFGTGALNPITFQRLSQQVTHPDDPGDDVRFAQQCLAGTRDSYVTSKRYVRPDGSVLDAELIVTLVRDRDGRPLYFLAQVLKAGGPPDDG